MRDGHPPAFLFYPSDFAGDGTVEAMTTEEVGSYILLLCKAWYESPVGSIPDNDLVLARWSRLTPDRWLACKPAVLAAFTLGTDSRWHQKRMRMEHAKLRRTQQDRSRRAKSAAESRWCKSIGSNEIHACSIADALLTQCKSNASPIENANSSSSKKLPEEESESTEIPVVEEPGVETEASLALERMIALHRTVCAHATRRHLAEQYFSAALAERPDDQLGRVRSIEQKHAAMYAVWRNRGDPKYVPGLHSWLRNRGWEDDVPTAQEDRAMALLMGDEG